jgi:hypothetical protein
MDTWKEIFSVAGLFLLRLGIPATVIILITWALRHLDARWRAEAEAEGRKALDVEVPPEAVIPLASERPCWEQRHCLQEKRELCPAYRHPTLPCWLARREVEGALPEPCYRCGIFTATGGVIESPAVVAH